MEALDLIEDCDGDLEDAVMTLAIRAGQEPEQTNSDWLDALAKNGERQFVNKNIEKTC